ncbi:T9SS type A sorting domain-containing protein [Vicingus serpentipes]|uniref:T9SS type A sorting domain-containing protein n=1 Tax=Vicingus serpentipes TaxID=1926625 RepID=A0A5C6RR57_9FLAO|nr:fibronectin type III domain-containing protein [Vicingus serpentipes]TXB64677.1 T9SS type A sorting domain-containing protein [Vicingus serpentipes]
MKKNTFFMSFLLLLSWQGMAQTTLYLTTSGGSFATEKWVEITDGPNGTGAVLWAQGNGTYGDGQGLVTDSAFTIVDGTTYYINCYDRYADSWDGTTYQIRTAPAGGGILIVNNGGVSPDDGTDNDAASTWEIMDDERESSEAFSYTPASCLQPGNLNVSNVTSISADLAWTENGIASTWDIEWDTTGFTPSTGNMITGTSSNPYNLTGLSPETSYEFYVRADCGGANGTSAWVGPFSFTTTCATYTPNYLEDFTIFTPNCWNEAGDGTPTTGYTGIGTGEWNHTRYLNIGAANDAVKINLYNVGTNDWLLSPIFDLSAGGWELAINAGVTSYNGTASINMGSDDTVQVLLSVDGGINWSAIYTWDVNNQPTNTGSAYTIDLSAYTGINNQFAIWATEGSIDDTEDFDFHINDFEIRIPPTCPAPSSLIAINIDGISADLGWTENGTASTWDIEWDTTGFSPGTGNMITGTSSNPYNLTGLIPETSYEFYVQADCGGSGTSTWVGPFSFTTTVSCQAPSAIMALAINPTDALIGWSENGSATSWQVEWGNLGFSLGSGFSEVTSSNPYLSMPLMPETPYDFYVRSICGAGDTSVWVGPFTFMTPCVASPITTFPWTEDFDGETTPNMPCGWIVDNANADAYTWETGTNQPNSGANAMQVRWNSAEAANDWAFTPELQLTGGVTYQLSFAFSVAGSTFPEKLKVMYGAGQNVAGMTDLLFDSTMTNTTYQTATALFTPPTTGSYYVGFHNYSDADMFRIYVDDVTVDIATAIEDNMLANNISIYPNPTTGIFTIVGTVKNTSVNVMSITGEVVYQNNISGNNTIIDLSNKAKGLYFVSISTENGTETYKMVIQ